MTLTVCDGVVPDWGVISCTGCRLFVAINDLSLAVVTVVGAWVTTGFVAAEDFSISGEFAEEGDAVEPLTLFELATDFMFSKTGLLDDKFWI